VLAQDAGAILPEILQALAQSGMSIASVAVVKPDLETVFLHVTGKALRD